MILNKTSSNGIFNIVDQFNNSLPVYCDFHSEPGFAWTLIQSHSLQNKDLFNGKAFYLHNVPTNEDTPEWNSYRLSKSRMQSIRDVSSHWRATCNFLTDKINFRDYIRASFAENDLRCTSLLTSVETCAEIVRLTLLTVQVLVTISTVGGSQQSVILTGGQGE